MTPARTGLRREAGGSRRRVPPMLLMLHGTAGYPIAHGHHILLAGCQTSSPAEKGQQPCRGWAEIQGPSGRHNSHLGEQAAADRLHPRTIEDMLASGGNKGLLRTIGRLFYFSQWDVLALRDDRFCRRWVLCGLPGTAHSSCSGRMPASISRLINGLF